MGERISAELAHSLLQSSHWHLSNNETCFDLLIYYTLRSCHWLTKSIEIILERWVRTSFPVSNLILDVTRMDRHSVNGEAVSQTEKVGGTHSNLAFTAEAPDIYWYLLIVHSCSFLAQQSFWHILAPAFAFSVCNTSWPAVRIAVRIATNGNRYILNHKS